jgi:class 3 adenylate cyclase
MKDNANDGSGGGELRECLRKIEEQNRIIAGLEEEKNDLQTLFDNVNEHSSQVENDYDTLINKMKRYLSPQLFDSIVGGGISSELSYRRKQLTIFFSDIVNFTSITDSTEPEVLSDCLNLYLNEMSNVAIRFGGTIDKFIGDAVMVFFGDPGSRGVKEDALACVGMAVEMQEKIRAIRSYWHERGIPLSLQVRMGINTGYCTVGNFGSKERMDYTIMGGQVNIASRLETASKPDGILISEATYELVQKHVDAVSMQPISVKGIHYPINTFLVSGLKEEANAPRKLLVQPIQNGFVMEKIVFDPGVISRDERDQILASLTRAIELLKSSS